MPFFIKKPITVEAVQLTNATIKEVYAFINGGHPTLDTQIAQDKWEEYKDGVISSGMRLRTMESNNETQVLTIGNWVIKGAMGEFYPIDDKVLRLTYDEQ